jgi:hypothetical protein
MTLLQPHSLPLSARHMTFSPFVGRCYATAGAYRCRETAIGLL